MAGRYNTWLRSRLADRIINNGGYHRGRSTSCALSWCVRYYGALGDLPSVVAALVECEVVDNELDLMLRVPDYDARINQYLARAVGQAYEYAQERLQEDLDEDEGMKMWSPETAKRYGFEYVGGGADRPFDMTLGGYGGGGKHVCLTEFEGVSLKMFCRDLSSWVGGHLDANDMPYSEGYASNQWCRKLMGIMDELDEVLTDENAKRCAQYYEVDWFARELGLFD